MSEPINDTYLTLEGPSEGFYKDKGSKFISLAYPVSSEEEVKEHLQALRKEYYDARHHCYAYIIGRDEALFRANDDGEPNNSAGPPILGQIRSNNLTNVLIVVIRYFGGTKLGVSGLIGAYKTGAALAIEAGNIIECFYEQTLHLAFEYPQMNVVMKAVKEYDLAIVSQEMQLNCEMELLVRESLLAPVREMLGDSVKYL